MKKYFNIKDFIFTIPASLILAVIIAFIQKGGNFFFGLPGFFLLTLIGVTALIISWRWADGSKKLAWMIGLALVLRLASGLAVYIALPINGNPAADDKAGFVFTDAHRRDEQAWQFASSGGSLTDAFNKTYYTDQYGGLLAFSALTYKIFSPDFHRPLMILLLAALTAALGVAFFYKSTRLLWDDKLATVSTWLFVLYPESVLTGGAQMREPFLLTFIAMAFWGFANFIKQQDGGERNKSVWLWLAIGIVGMLLVSPAMALALMVLFGVWLWLRGEKNRLPWQVWAAVGGVFIVGVLLLAYSLSRSHDFGGGSPVSIILNWIRSSGNWVVYQLQKGSGQIQNVFSKINNPLANFLFVTVYGIVQPVLPPTFFAPTTLTWHIILIFRALGWYAVLPFLIYAPFAAWKSAPGRERRLWLWLTAFSWIWIVTCSIRAGGSQWDNPRYRLIFFGWQALVAGYAWLWWRAHRDGWLPRIIALEIFCLLLFSQWYLARYYQIGIHLPIMVVLGLGITALILTFVGGWLWDRWKKKTA
jgi:hypothetical protein